MICVTINANKVLEASFNDMGGCDNLIILSYSEFAQFSEQITTAQVLTDFSWGFGVVLFFWSLGFAVDVAQKLIRKL